MGTPEIAATCLKKLIDDGKNIIAAVTGEDKVRGRGRTLTPTAVKALAEEHGIPTYTPKTLRDESFAQLLEQLAPELIVVVAYGKILPKNVIDFPKYGCMNVHVSLLPKYRGAAPMQRAIMNGEEKTGVTVMYMDEGLDTGDIIAVSEFPICKCDNFETVHDKSAELGGALMSRVIDDCERGLLTRTPQDSSLATYAAKIEDRDARLELSMPAEKLDFIIRGLSPIPCAYLMQDDKIIKVLSATPCDGCGRVGEVIDVDGRGEGSFTVACGEGALKITKIIPAGKGKMSAGDYVRGRKIAKGDVLL